jgi:aspartyl protease family protein
MAGWIVAFLFLLAGAAAMALAEGAPSLGLSKLDASYAVFGFCIAVVTFWVLSIGRNHGVARAFRDLGSWLLLTTAVAAGYTYRDDLLSLGHSIAAEITPSGMIARADVQSNGDRAVRIRRRPDGHFLARVELNGFTLNMLVDTGASTVVLRPADAQKLGIDTERLRYNVPVQTANGTTYAAQVKLKRVAVGAIEFTEIDALVSKPGALRDSLLGMSFLNRLKSYEFSGDFLTLRI